MLVHRDAEHLVAAAAAKAVAAESDRRNELDITFQSELHAQEYVPLCQASPLGIIPRINYLIITKLNRRKEQPHFLPPPFQSSPCRSLKKLTNTAVFINEYNNIDICIPSTLDEQYIMLRVLFCSTIKQIETSNLQHYVSQ